METLQRTANRGSISTGPYQIDNSLKFEPDNSEYLTKSQSNGNKKTWTCSFWFKRTELNDSDFPAFISASSSSWQTRIAIFNNGGLWVDLGYGTSYYRNITNALIRDTAAWYHVVVAVDSTQATASNRLKVYLNGVLVTSWNTQNLPAQDTEFKFFDSNHAMFIGSTTATDFRFAGYMADMHVVDGTQLAQTDFGEFDDDSGIWKPKAYTGSYGSQGFYLDFKSSGSLGADSSGNGNNFTLNNITAADQSTDTPTNNFATAQGGLLYYAGTTKTEGSTAILRTGSSASTSYFSTMAVSNGKWYAEFQKTGTSRELLVGIADSGNTTFTNGSGTNVYVGSTADSIGLYGLLGMYAINASFTNYSPLFDSQIISVAVNMDDRKIHWAINNTWVASTDPTSSSSGLTIPATIQSAWLGFNLYTVGETMKINYGGFTTMSISSAATDANGYGTFEYAPPSGYYALCTKNLAEYG